MISGPKQRRTNMSGTGIHTISISEILTQKLKVVIATAAVMVQVATMKKTKVLKVNLQARVKNQAITVALQ